MPIYPATSRPPLFYIILGLTPWPVVFYALYNLHSAWAAFGLYHTVCILGWAFVRPKLPKFERIPRPPRYWINLALICLVTNITVYFCAVHVANLLDPPRVLYVLQAIHAVDTPTLTKLLFAYFAIANPIFEELFWRRTIYQGLHIGGMPASKSATISGCLFGAWHLVPISMLFSPGLSILAVVGVGLSGISLTNLYSKSKSLTTGIILHALGADVPLLLILWLDVLKG